MNIGRQIMTDLEWNVRAAKALGWNRFKIRGENYGRAFVLPKDLAVNLKTGSEVVTPKNMHFDSSYDWAMLGVKVVNIIKPGGQTSHNSYLENLRRLVVPQGSCGGYAVIKKEWHYILNATPAQITEAWVIVLEGEWRMSYQSTIQKLKANNVDVRHVQKMLTSIKQLEQTPIPAADLEGEIK